MTSMIAIFKNNSILFIIIMIIMIKYCHTIMLQKKPCNTKIKYKEH